MSHDERVDSQEQRGLLRPFEPRCQDRAAATTLRDLALRLDRGSAATPVRSRSRAPGRGLSGGSRGVGGAATPRVGLRQLGSRLGAWRSVRPVVRRRGGIRHEGASPAPAGMSGSAVLSEGERMLSIVRSWRAPRDAMTTRANAWPARCSAWNRHQAPVQPAQSPSTANRSAHARRSADRQCATHQGVNPAFELRRAWNLHEEQGLPGSSRCRPRCGRRRHPMGVAAKGCFGKLNCWRPAVWHRRPSGRACPDARMPDVRRAYPSDSSDAEWDILAPCSHQRRAADALGCGPSAYTLYPKR